MKYRLLILVSLSAMLWLNSCKKEEDTTANLCNNGIKDGRESEIDCGGDCDACPDLGTLSLKENGVNGTVLFVSNNVAGQKLNPSIRVAGTNQNNSPFNFMFIPSALNTQLPVNASSFDYAGEPYTKSSTDTGSVIITAHDTLRHIISGTFSFQGERVTQGFVKCNITEGVFTNVRYH